MVIRFVFWLDNIAVCLEIIRTVLSSVFFPYTFHAVYFNRFILQAGRALRGRKKVELVVVYNNGGPPLGHGV